MTAHFNSEIPRDRYQRPLIRPTGWPEDGSTQRVACRRTTTFVGVLESTWNINEWDKRKVVEGMGQRKDLVLAAAAADPDDKKLLNEIATKAKEHALAGAAATTGTALHSLTQRVDSGLPLGSVPDGVEDDIRAYQQATKALEHIAIEQFRVYDPWRVAGTADRVSRFQGSHFVTDIKTGSIDYPHKIAMQLAMYAHSVPYDTMTDERTENVPGLRLDKALIIHLPAGQAHCELVWVDIQKGWRGCGIAKQVWDWRDTKELTWEAVGDEDENRLPTLVESAMNATDLDQLRELWRKAKANSALDSTFMRAVDMRRTQLEMTA
jgi:hypothetical protein